VTEVHASGSPERYLHLKGRRASALLEMDEGGAPLWRYWGPAIADHVSPPKPLRALRSTPSFSLDADQPLSLFPTFGLGWFHQSALLAHRGGQDFAQAFTHCAVEETSPGREAVVRLTDPKALIAVTIALRMDDDALTIVTTLTNAGAEPLEVQWLAAGVVPLSAEAASVRSYGGRHLSEFHPQVDALGRSLWRRENRRGLTSHDNFPGAVVATSAATAHSGLAYGAQLAWSGNHVQTIEQIDDGRFQWQMGEWLAPGEVRLAPGGSITTPEMVVAASDEGLNGVAAAFHGAARARLAWPGGAMRPRPVSFNTWEGNYFDHDFASLTSQADLAAALGMERFVLDDGWFRGRDNDRAGLGDWTADAVKYPEGLGPLVDHVRGLGLEFGLWVEPEMVNPDSDLYRRHPEWALQLADRPIITGRNQLVLDMSLAEVRDYLFDHLDRLLRAHPIAYLKWDHNRDLTAAGSHGLPAYRAQVLGAYALFGALRRAHPGVEIEACAGGGGRIDLGVLAHTHRFWTSDCIDARARIGIQRGFLQFMPPEVMGAHVGTSPAHTTSRRQGMNFRAAVALGGHLGVELDPRRLDETARQTLARWIDLYKQWRGLLHGGRVWLGEAADGLLWQAQGRDDASEILLCVFRLDPQVLRHAAAVTLPMVDRSAAYRATPLYPEGPAWDVDGEWLARVGLTTPRMGAEQSWVLHLQRRA